MNTVPDHTEVLRKAVELNGGTSAVARKMRISKQRLDNWLKRGVPWKRAPEVEKHLGVSRQVLRPHDWEKHWPRLAKRLKRTEGATNGHQVAS